MQYIQFLVCRLFLAVGSSLVSVTFTVLLGFLLVSFSADVDKTGWLLILASLCRNWTNLATGGYLPLCSLSLFSSTFCSAIQATWSSFSYIPDSHLELMVQVSEMLRLDTALGNRNTSVSLCCQRMLS